MRRFAFLSGGPLPRRLSVGFGVAGACALLGGCILGSDMKVDARSPIAAEAPKLAKTNRDYPSFSEIPAVPNDVRPRALYGKQAAALVAQRDQLIAATAPNTWTLTGTESFAASGRQAAGPEIAPPAPADTEAFANDLRKRATPPPPPTR